MGRGSRNLERAVLLLLHRQQVEALTALRADRLPDLSRHTEAMTAALMPFLHPLYLDGATQTARRLSPALEQRHAKIRPGAPPRQRRRGADVGSARQVRGVAGQSPRSGLRAGAGLALESDPLRTKRLAAAARALLQLIQPRLLEAVRRLTFDFCAETNRTSRLHLVEARAALRRELAEGLAEGEAVRTLTARVRRIFDTPRARAIAVTETARATHAGQVLAAEESGVVQGLKWLTPSDSCDLCLPLAGKIVKLGEPFVVLPGGGPYAVVRHPPYHPHCRCSVSEILSEEWS